MSTSETHEAVLKNFLTELKEKGYTVIDLERKCPDGIAVKDGKIYAVEVLGRKHVKNKGFARKTTPQMKREIYHMFNDVLIKEFKYGGILK